MNHKILALLRENARMGIQEIALRTGLSETEAEQEIHELEKSGVIRGYTAILNESELDDNKVKALIEVKVTPRREGGFDQVARRIARFPEVTDLPAGGGLVRLRQTLHHRRGPLDLHKLFAEEIQRIRQDHAE